MLVALRSRLSYANVMSTIAVFVALGGSAYAIGLGPNSIGPQQIKNNAVGPTEIQNNAITSSKVKPQSLLGTDFKTGQLPKGQKGDAGLAGTQGLQGTSGTNGTDGTDGTDGANATLPTGAVVFFNQNGCPSGFNAFTQLEGRYPVGLPSGGSANTQVGSALTNLENRPVGRHDHATSTVAHAHAFSISRPTTLAGLTGTGDRVVTTSSMDGASTRDTTTWVVSTAVLDMFGNTTAMVTGTNAPYIQLQACRKT